MTICLPRERLSIPVVRRTLNGAMRAIGIEQGDADDVTLAVSEACTNVLDHVEDGDEYEVVCSLFHDVMAIDVVDTGRGFDYDSLGHAPADHSAEEGRGLHLIRSLTDGVTFEHRPERGMVVHFEKRLHLPDSAPARLLTLSRERSPRADAASTSASAGAATSAELARAARARSVATGSAGDAP